MEREEPFMVGALREVRHCWLPDDGQALAPQGRQPGASSPDGRGGCAMRAMTWQRESAEIIAEDATLQECRVCHAPVRVEDEPVNVELIPRGVGPTQPGVIHGAFSCMD